MTAIALSAAAGSAARSRASGDAALTAEEDLLTRAEIFRRVDLHAEMTTDVDGVHGRASLDHVLERCLVIFIEPTLVAHAAL